jgi:hypothetical protein
MILWEHCFKLHAEAIRSCNLAQIAAIIMVAHACAREAAFQSQASCYLRDSGDMHPMCMTYGTCSFHDARTLTSRREYAGSGRPAPSVL